MVRPARSQGAVEHSMHQGFAASAGALGLCSAAIAENLGLNRKLSTSSRSSPAETENGNVERQNAINFVLILKMLWLNQFLLRIWIFGE